MAVNTENRNTIAVFTTSMPGQKVMSDKKVVIGTDSNTISLAFFLPASEANTVRVNSPVFFVEFVFHTICHPLEGSWG